MSLLPPTASPGSRHRADLAADLAASCPQELGREIALTGSAARGVADEHSDVEINLWVDRRPSYGLCRTWLEEAGAEEIHPAFFHDSAGWAWLTCRYRGIWVEVGWAAIDQWEELVRGITAGETAAHRLLILGWVIRHAVPLRTSGLLAGWQTRFAEYPDSLQGTIIADQTDAWSDPHVPFVRWALADRRELFTLSLRLTWDVQNVLRVLFATNRHWDHDLKWTDERSLDLPIKPANLSTRINAIFGLADPHARVRADLGLIEETLLLVPAHYDVSRPLANIRAALSAREESHGEV